MDEFDAGLGGFGSEPSESPTPKLIYDSHRTTKKGSVVLSFIDPKSGEEYVMFFNVDVRIQRGSNKGNSHRTGQGGKFYPALRSKFRRFWLNAIGEPPRRWAEAYKYLRPRLKNKVFSGAFIVQLKSETGAPYNKLKFAIASMDKAGTTHRQNGDNAVTTLGDNLHTTNSKEASMNTERLNENSEEQHRTANQVHYNTATQEHDNTTQHYPPIRPVHEKTCPHCIGEGCKWCE